MSPTASQAANIWLVHTSLPSEAQAQHMANTLVETGLAACVQVQPVPAA